MTENNNQARVGDIGTLIQVDMQENISEASKWELHVLKPDFKTIVIWIGVANGVYIEYTTLSGDLDMEGDYIIAPYIEGLSGWSGHGVPVVLSVYGEHEKVE